MTRKHFEAIAEAIRLTDMDSNAKQDLADNMAANLNQFNSNFNETRFIEACGV